jgi:hypothetical protein
MRKDYLQLVHLGSCPAGAWLEIFNKQVLCSVIPYECMRTVPRGGGGVNQTSSHRQFVDIPYIKKIIFYFRSLAKNCLLLRKRILTCKNV